MSVQALSAVLEDSQARLGPRLVMIAIANHANAQGENSFPSLETLADEARMSVRQVIRCIQELEQLGELRVQRGTGRTHSNRYIIQLLRLKGAKLSPPADPAPQAVKGDNPGPEMSPEPLRTRSKAKTMTPTGSALPATNGRKDIEITARYLKRLEPVLASGSSFDMLHEFRELWEPAWQEAIDQGITPTSVGRNLLATFIATVTGQVPDYGRAAQLVGRYGKLALLGIDEGLIANARDPYRYAHRVCSNQAAVHRSEV